MKLQYRRVDAAAGKRVPAGSWWRSEEEGKCVRGWGNGGESKMGLGFYNYFI